MPRDLGLEEKRIPQTESPSLIEEFEEQHVNRQLIPIKDLQVQSSRHSDSIGKLHPYTRLLTISDLDSCVALENAAFPIKQERASREKVSSMILYSALGQVDVTYCVLPSCDQAHDYVTRRIPGIYLLVAPLHIETSYTVYDDCHCLVAFGISRSFRSSFDFYHC